MSDLPDGTRGQTPDDVRRVTPPRTFEAGEAVPGLSSWILERRLGGGGFGEVWLAKHAWDAEQKPRAVKFCTDPAAKNRLVTHERNVVVRVMKYAGKHPNIVPLLDCNLDGDVPWLMYEFVEGGTLADAMKQWRDLPLPKRLGRAVKVLHPLSGALAACHRLDPPLVHRDLKPHNVLMAGPVPRITDFGIGGVVVPPAVDAATGALTAYAAQVPSMMHGAGTPGYAPPEQRLGGPPDPRDDVYALGVIAYQMALGEPTALPGADAALELRELKVPGELASLVVASVAVSADRRPRDAAEWESRLAALFQKSRRPAGVADAPAPGSEPVLLPKADSAARPPAEQPQDDAHSAVGPAPEPTAGPVQAAGPLSLPPAAERSPRPARRRRGPRTLGRRQALAVALGGTLVLILAAAAVIVLLSLGKRSEPSSPTEQVEKPEAKGGGAKASPGPAVASAPRPDDARDIEIAPGVKMAFCWVPAGECQLGSPKAERDNALKLLPEAEEPKALQTEAEERRGTFKTGGFWMGKYEVTQAEWKAVMGDNPSEFDGTKDNKAKGMDTGRFPVESVSWFRVCGQGKYTGEGFLDRIDHGGIQKALGRPGKFRLPTENEWEYACRGGRGNKRPFYWGGELNGTQANCQGFAPYGTSVPGQSLGRPCAVDFTNGGKYEPHPWGLMHMSGNVWEWCENNFDKANGTRVMRGGAWCFLPIHCRAAHRGDFVPGSGTNGIGFRLVIAGPP